MVIVTGKYPQAQLVGLRGLASLAPGFQLPPGIQSTIKAVSPTITQSSSAGSVGNSPPICLPGSAPAPCACADGTTGTKPCSSDGMSYGACTCGKKTNWLLWGGLALVGVVAWKVLR